MEFSESTKIVYDRIKTLEPENVSKIIGYILVQDNGEREMIRLACCPDTMIHAFISKAKSDLRLSKWAVSAPVSAPQVIAPPGLDIPSGFSPYSSHSFVLPASLCGRNAYWDSRVPSDLQQGPSLDYISPGYSSSLTEGYPLQNRMQLLRLEDHVESANSIGSNLSSNHFYWEPGVRTRRRSPSLPDFPVRVCQYFNRGYCKHGNNCRYLHDHLISESFSPVFATSPNDAIIEDHGFSPQSLEKLELEITDLLKSKNGEPVSIASLPMRYHEKFGRNLQADGYLTESQRHGKSGYSLTKLLARMNNIRLIDRPHGQHSVILAEDFPKYLEYYGERSGAGGIVAGSRQIYLTFPAESTFTVEDVSNYFSKFGLVQDVRIPCQQKRMFGFVTFAYAETAKQVLRKGNPHFVAGARVLVKPYREKSRSLDRKHAENIQHYLVYNQQSDGDSDLHIMPSFCNNSRLPRENLVEDHGQLLEVERRRLSELQLAQRPMAEHPYSGNSTDGSKFSEGQPNFPSAEQFSYYLGLWSYGSSTSEDRLGHSLTNQNDHDSQGFNLPDSPFASPVRKGISTAT